MSDRDVANRLFRKALCEILAGLMDASYQKQRWMDGNFADGGYTFDMMIAVLFDDTEIAFDADRSIGIILLNEQEAEHVMLVGDTIRVLRTRHGIDLSDAQYVEKPEWQNVMTTARIAHDLICCH